MPCAAFFVPTQRGDKTVIIRVALRVHAFSASGHTFCAYRCSSVSSRFPYRMACCTIGRSMCMSVFSWLFLGEHFFQGLIRVLPLVGTGSSRHQPRPALRSAPHAHHYEALPSLLVVQGYPTPRKGSWLAPDAPLPFVPDMGTGEYCGLRTGDGTLLRWWSISTA